MHTTEFTISTKKGETQKTRWLIVQSHPWPRISAQAGTLQWENGDGLFPRYGSPAQGIGSKYVCYLIPPGIEIPKDYNRTHFAGYTHRPGAYGTPEVTNPGTIQFRGKDLGELSVTFGDDPDYPEIRSEVTGYVTGSALDMIRVQVIPPLREYIKRNAAQLKAQAVEALRERMAQEISETGAELAKLKTQAFEILKTL